MPHDIFISHSIKDQVVCDLIYDHLTRHGIQCFMDSRDLIPGISFPTQLVNAIKKSKVVVLVFSSNSDSSGPVQNEIGLAINNKIPVIPVRTENIFPNELALFINNTQWLDIFPPPTEKHLTKLISTIKVIVHVPEEEVDVNNKLTRKKEPDNNQEEEISDLEWHDVDINDISSWLIEHKKHLDVGEIVKGKTFYYRLDTKTGRIQRKLIKLPLPDNKYQNIDQPIIVGICGRSCSGKGVVTETLASINKDILLLQADLYFNNSTSCNYKGYQCWDHTNCISFDRLINNLHMMKNCKDTVIHVETPWMPQVDIHMDQKDMRSKKLIIIDGFLIFAIKELVDMFDIKVFVEASDATILQRRQTRNGGGQINYIKDVVIPVSKEYEKLQKDNADVIIDGNRSKTEVIYDIGKYLNNKLKEMNSEININLPPQYTPWEVHPGDYLMDNTWHPIKFENLKEWVKKKKDQINNNEVLKGNTFRYRRNPESQCYEIRLSSQYKPNIYRYTLENSSKWK
jgi:uridine kinase